MGESLENYRGGSLLKKFSLGQKKGGKGGSREEKEWKTGRNTSQLNKTRQRVPERGRGERRDGGGKGGEIEKGEKGKCSYVSFKSGERLM